MTRCVSIRASVQTAEFSVWKLRLGERDNGLFVGSTGCAGGNQHLLLLQRLVQGFISAFTTAVRNKDDAHLSVAYKYHWVWKDPVYYCVASITLIFMCLIWTYVTLATPGGLIQTLLPVDIVAVCVISRSHIPSWIVLLWLPRCPLAVAAATMQQARSLWCSC